MTEQPAPSTEQPAAQPDSTPTPPPATPIPGEPSGLSREDRIAYRTAMIFDSILAANRRAVAAPKPRKASTPRKSRKNRTAAPADTAQEPTN
jgi:hypothetical protein